MTIYINGTSGISGVDGSAGTPAIQGTDANTGVLFPAADTWAVAVGGVEKIRVQSSGMSGCITAGTSVASTSGTSIDFTGIPSWVKRITVMFNGVSTTSTSDVIIQLGDSGGFEITGYAGSATWVSAANQNLVQYTTGLAAIVSPAATGTAHALVTICNLSGNSWTATTVQGDSTSNYSSSGCVSKTLSDVLTQIRITTVSGTPTFDAGTINILYEG